jgi:hypothetical protein
MMKKFPVKRKQEWDFGHVIFSARYDSSFCIISSSKIDSIKESRETSVKQFSDRKSVAVSIELIFSRNVDSNLPTDINQFRTPSHLVPKGFLLGFYYIPKDDFWNNFG